MKISEMNLEQAKKYKKLLNEVLTATKPSNRMVSIGIDTNPTKIAKWTKHLAIVNNRISELTK